VQGSCGGFAFVVGRGSSTTASIGGGLSEESVSESEAAGGTPLGFVLFAFPAPVPLPISLSLLLPLLPGLLRRVLPIKRSNALPALSIASATPRASGAGGDVALQDRDLEVEVLGQEARARS